MPGGVVFLIVVPTANFERQLLNGKNYLHIYYKIWIIRWTPLTK